MDLMVVIFLTFIISEFSKCDRTEDKFILFNNYNNINNRLLKKLRFKSINDHQVKTETSSKNLNLENFSFQYKQLQNSNNNQQTVEIQSPNYPQPYPVNKLTKFIISVNNSAGIELIIQALDINEEKDFLKFIPITENIQNEQKPILILTGKQTVPMKFRILNTKKLQMEFGAFINENHNHKGFILTYKPYDNVHTNSTIPKPPNLQIPLDKLDDICKLIIVPENQQINSTWENFRNLLCEATNNWMKNNNYSFETCKTNNVTFKSISKCPEFWSNYLTCIQFQFSISLYLLDEQQTTVNPLIEESIQKYPAGLTNQQLEIMWNEYARNIFKKSGIYEYNKPNKLSIILLCIGLSFIFIIIIFIILYVLYRLNMFNYNINQSKQNNNNNSNGNLYDKPEIDVTMIPSPNQIMPDVVERYANDLYERNLIKRSLTKEYHENDPMTINQRDNIKKPFTKLDGGVVNPGFVKDDEIQ